MNKANYEIVRQDDQHVLIRDLGPWDIHPTITNVVESVVAELLPMLNGRRLEYIDSDNEHDEILIRGGRFAGFKFLK
jgi:hypothetical protein